jgi:hypothetical protein
MARKPAGDQVVRKAQRAPALAARRPWTAALAILLVFGSLGKAQVVEGPRRLPSPEVPVERLPPVTTEASSSQGGTTAPRTTVPPPTTVPPRTTAPPAPYLGPPMVIDGPGATAGPPPGIGMAPEEIRPPASAGEGIFFPDDPFAEGYPEEELYELGPQKLSPYKNGFFQKLSFSAGWFGDSNDPTDLGGTEIETFLTVAVPAPIVEWPLLITPGINVSFIDGPTVTDLPDELYYTYVDFMWLPKIFHNWTLLLSVATNVFGDFEANEFRLTGKGLVIYDAIPERLQFIAGVLYLNRDNVEILPAGGIIWTPVDWTRLEILFPKPKFGLRLNCQPGYEDWIFTTAEFGGNTWPIIRVDGSRDNVTYADYRVLAGFERKLNGGAGYRLEAGYVFGREIRYTSTVGDFDPKDTILIRGAIVY